MGFLFQTAISLVACVVTLSVQIYFWRSYSFTLPQSNYFDTAVTLSEHLFLHDSCFFSGAPFSKQLLLRNNYIFQNSYFFKVKLLPNSFLLIEIVLQGSYFSDQLPFSWRDTISQLCLLSTAALPIYQLSFIRQQSSELDTSKSVGVLLCVSITAQSRIVDKV